jgi:type VI secretion system secreted protein VgrG
MTPVRPANEADFYFRVDSYSGADLLPYRFRGEEAVSELFRFEIELVSENLDVDFDSVLGKKALLTLQGEEGTRYISGIVSRFFLLGGSYRLTHYRAEVVPRVWLLGLRQDSRIFQEMSVPDIIRKVLNDAGVPADEYRLSLQRAHKNREYCVQYCETDLAFISRLMEEEGIFYFFEHSDNTHVLIMSDSLSIHIPVEGRATLGYREPSGEMPAEEHVYAYRYGHAVCPGKAVLRDFDFKKPKLDLTQEKQAEKDTQLEVYAYPGEYYDPGEGKSLVEVRLQELQAPRKIGTGSSTSFRLVPGFKFTLEKHPRGDFNREHLLTRILHEGTQPQSMGELAPQNEHYRYDSRFSCIPSDVQFRPPRITPRPVIHGSQTAIVTGPQGEEICVDEHGRIKVQFHWDRQGKRDDKSSCWIRVSQTWASTGWGSVFIPRIGQEVIVDFLEGNPDNPIVTGCVYNGINPPPYQLPAGKTKSTVKSDSSLGGGGSNELRFEDAKGGEEIYLHGQKDWNIVIENDKSQSVGHDESLHVGHDRTKHVGHNQAETVDNNKNIQVGVNHTEKIGSNKSLTVGADHTENIGSNMTINIGSNLTETVALNYSETVGIAMDLTVGAALSQTVGAAMVESVGASKSVSVGVNASESVGGNSSESVGGNRSTDVGKDFTQKIKGKRTVTVGKDNSESVDADHSLKVKKKISVEAGDQISIVTGQAKIVMKKDGNIVISGKKIQIEGQQEVALKAMKINSEAQTKSTLKGTMVNVEASGIMTIKGALVKIN